MSNVPRTVGLLCVLSLSVGFNMRLHSQDMPDARGLVRTGRISLEENDPYTAVAAFRSALRINPSYADARLGMAESLFLLGEYEEAGREIDKARDFSSGNREMTLLEARILTALRKYDSAATIYQGLLEKRPHDAEANRGLAEIYAILGQRELAGEAYDRTLRYSPEDQRVLLQLVILHDAARERAQAEAALTQALQRYPENLFVRLQAAEHFALYGEWQQSMEHLDRAKSMVESTDPKFRRIGLLDAELSLRRGDPAEAIAVLNTLPDQNTTEVLYLMARAYRQLGNEELSQARAKALLTLDPEDEIARMYREEALFRTAEGYKADRIDASSWHLEKGRRFEEGFFYRRAYDEYRRAQLIAKTDPNVWIVFADLIRKMGFPEYYRATLNVALQNIPPERAEFATLKRRLDLLQHSQEQTLAQRWGVDEPWIVPEAGWTIGVFITDQSSSLPIHGGADDTLSLYFADIVDAGSNLEVPSVSGINDLMVRRVSGFSEAFRYSREQGLDYFLMMGFVETERTFHATAELFLARTGESLGRLDQLRTGQGRVADALHGLSDDLQTKIPRKMKILDVEGSTVLLDKGRWNGIDDTVPWIVLRDGAGRPAAVEGGLSYAPSDYLGSVEIDEISEPLSEGTYVRSGDFEFIRPGDEAYLLPIPEQTSQVFEAPDPAFRASMLAIP